jgi:hypothetical protein
MSSDSVEIADVRRSSRLTEIIDRLRSRGAEMISDVAADLGAADPDAVAPTVLRFLDMITGGPGLGDADRLRLRQEGATAARHGQPLASLLDGYLSTAWVTWDHAVGLDPPLPPAATRTLGAALLRAGDDIAAEVSDGYTAAERALATTAGATRQAILEELLTRTPLDAGSTARLLRRAALAGLDPGQAHHVLVLRTAGDPESNGDLVDELERRLARDPVRRPSLVAARGVDVVAVAGAPWRDGPAFADLTTELTDQPWWGVVAGPVALEALAQAYAESVEALRLAPGLLPAGSLVGVDALALERALVADPILAVAAVDRWLGPLVTAPRGGGALVRTLEAWLGAGQSVTATARALGVAPRTVSYRLDRIASLLGQRSLGPDVVARLSAALLMSTLVAPDRVASAP